MAVNSSRSMNQSLDAGATDGKYRKARPDTEESSMQMQVLLILYHLAVYITLKLLFNLI